MRIYIVFDESSMMRHSVLMSVFRHKKDAEAYIKADPLYGPYVIRFYEVK